MLEERTITGTFNYQYCKEKIHEWSLCRMSWHQDCEQHLSTLTRVLTQDFQYSFSPREDLMKVDSSWPKMQQNGNKLHVRSVMSDLMDYSPPGSSVHGVFQVRILQWVAISYFRGSSQPGMEPVSPCLLHWQVDSLSLHHVWCHKVKVKPLVAQSCPPSCPTLWTYGL